MRVAAIYDIHGNLPALKAVLQELRREDVDHVVVGGDVVPGPMVRETLTRLWRSLFPSSSSTGMATLRCSRRWPVEIIRPSQNSTGPSSGGWHNTSKLNTGGS